LVVNFFSNPTAFTVAPIGPANLCGGFSHSKGLPRFKTVDETTKTGQKPNELNSKSSLKILGLENLLKIGRIVETITVDSQRFYFISG